MSWNGIWLSSAKVLLHPLKCNFPPYRIIGSTYTTGTPLLCFRNVAMEISPHLYVIQQRVERAKLMLSKTDLAIAADIAIQVGFSSQSHLTQQFKRFIGMTPRQVR
jgi:AraC-like DNA-binding protein